MREQRVAAHVRGIWQSLRFGGKDLRNYSIRVKEMREEAGWCSGSKDKQL